MELANSQGERRLIGALFVSPEKLTEVSGQMVETDFFHPEYRHTFRAMCELHLAGAPVSVDTVAARLNVPDDKGKNTLVSIGGVATIRATMDGANPGEIEFWVDDTIKNRKRREMHAELERAMAKLVDTGNPDRLRAELEEGLANLGSGSTAGEYVHASSVTDQLRARVQGYIDNPDGITGLETGWAPFDRMLDGIQPWESTIIYAKTGSFKSFFVQNMAYHFARQGVPGLMFTTEMPVVQVQERMLQIHCGLNLQSLRRAGSIGLYREEILRGNEEIATLPIYYADGFDVTTSTIKSGVRRQKRWNGIEWVVVDLIDHVGTKRFRDDIINQQADIMSNLKKTAKAESVAMLSVTHVSKTGREYDRLPSLPLDDMKGSSAKSQDVDRAICVVPVKHGIPPELMMRANPPPPAWYAINKMERMEEFRTKGGCWVQVTIQKNRHGDEGPFWFWLDISRGGRFTLDEWRPLPQ